LEATRGHLLSRSASVDLDLSVDFPDEHVRGEEADRSRTDPESEDDDEGVAEVQDGRYERRDAQLCRKKRKTDLRIQTHASKLRAAKVITQQR